MKFIYKFQKLKVGSPFTKVAINILYYSFSDAEESDCDEKRNASGFYVLNPLSALVLFRSDKFVTHSVTK